MPSITPEEAAKAHANLSYIGQRMRDSAPPNTAVGTPTIALRFLVSAWIIDDATLASALLRSVRAGLADRSWFPSAAERAAWGAHFLAWCGRYGLDEMVAGLWPEC